jgi:hypothetical protein
MFHMIDAREPEGPLTDRTGFSQRRLPALSITLHYYTISTTPITQPYECFDLSMEVDLVM